MKQINKALRAESRAIDERRSYPGRARWTRSYKRVARRAARRAPRLAAALEGESEQRLRVAD